MPPPRGRGIIIIHRQGWRVFNGTVSTNRLNNVIGV